MKKTTLFSALMLHSALVCADPLTLHPHAAMDPDLFKHRGSFGLAITSPDSMRSNLGYSGEILLILSAGQIAQMSAGPIAQMGERFRSFTMSLFSQLWWLAETQEPGEPKPGDAARSAPPKNTATQNTAGTGDRTERSNRKSGKRSLPAGGDDDGDDGDDGNGSAPVGEDTNPDDELKRLQKKLAKLLELAAGMKDDGYDEDAIEAEREAAQVDDEIRALLLGKIADLNNNAESPASKKRRTESSEPTFQMDAEPSLLREDRLKLLDFRMRALDKLAQRYSSRHAYGMAARATLARSFIMTRMGQPRLPILMCEADALRLMAQAHRATGDNERADTYNHVATTPPSGAFSVERSDMMSSIFMASYVEAGLEAAQELDAAGVDFLENGFRNAAMHQFTLARIRYVAIEQASSDEETKKLAWQLRNRALLRIISIKLDMLRSVDITLLGDSLDDFYTDCHVMLFKCDQANAADTGGQASALIAHFADDIMRHSTVLWRRDFWRTYVEDHAYKTALQFHEDQASRYDDEGNPEAAKRARYQRALVIREHRSPDASDSSIADRHCSTAKAFTQAQAYREAAQEYTEAAQRYHRVIQERPAHLADKDVIDKEIAAWESAATSHDKDGKKEAAKDARKRAADLRRQFGLKKGWLETFFGK